MVFYRKYRPQKFADIVGQENTRETLLAQLTSGKISHGYLFAGPRGTGKTSTARIFAKAVNCQSKQLTIDKKQLTKKGQRSNVKGRMSFGEPCNKCVSCLAVADGSHLDLVEIDAASNRGIDEIRDLREKIKLSPVSSRFKVYIIDEAHMLTTEAFNALLKTLEEPPAHAIFILCTTAASKLPSTIISRLTRFNFKRAKDDELMRALSAVAKSEGLLVEDEAFAKIAKVADGSFRDAVSVLDQLAAKGKKIRAGDVDDLGGVFGWDQTIDFINTLSSGDLKKAVLSIENLERTGGDVSLFIKDLVLTLERLILVKIGADEAAFSDFDSEQAGQIQTLAQKFSFNQLQNMMKLFLVAESEIKIYPLPKIPLILAVCKICPEPEPVNRTVGESVDQRASEPVSRKSQTAKHRKAKIKLSEIVLKWGEFLEKVRKFNVHLVAILKSSRPVDVSGDILTIEVYFRFHKDKLEEPKIVGKLEGFLEEVFGVRIGLRFILVEKQKGAPRAVRQSDVVEASREDLAKVAAEIFSK